VRVLQVHIVTGLEVFIRAGAIADCQVLAAILIDVGKVDHAVLAHQTPVDGFTILVQRHLGIRSLQLLEDFEGSCVAYRDQGSRQVLQVLRHLREQHFDQVFAARVIDRERTRLGHGRGRQGHGEEHSADERTHSKHPC